MKEKFFRNKNKMIGVPYALLVVGLTILYIANVHRAERNLRRVKDLKASVKEAKWECQDLQQSIMLGATEIELLKVLEGKGMQRNTSVPKKIIIEESKS